MKPCRAHRALGAVAAGLLVGFELRGLNLDLENSDDRRQNGASRGAYPWIDTAYVKVREIGRIDGLGVPSL